MYILICFFLAVYPVLGAGLKYIDNAFDEKIFSKKVAYVLAPLLGVLWAVAMILDAASATILLAIVLGVLLKGKIDNWAHVVGMVVIFAVLLVTGVQLLWIPLVVLTLGAIFDEVGNDFIDKKGYLASKKLGARFAGFFFDQRWLTKVVIVVLSVFGLIPWYFFVAMVFFDYAYLGVRWYGELRVQKQNQRMLVVSSREIADG
ncbi:MAG: hypothetical protein QXX20_04955 [Candidatus Thermoplasmatota archaeon]